MTRSLSKTSIPKAPAGLGKSGRAWWRIVHDAYVFEPAQYELVAKAARQLDLAELARAILEKEGLTTTGRFGGTQAHPMIAVEHNATSMFRHIARQLRITSEEGQTNATP
jgi:phage terminase small subunit